MTLVLKLLMFAVGFVLAFYALMLGPGLIPQRLPEVLANPNLQPTSFYVAAAVLTILTGGSIFFSFLSWGDKPTRVTYGGILWVLVLLIADSFLFGVLLVPNTSNLWAWLMVQPGEVRLAALFIALPVIMMLGKGIVLIFKAVEEYEARLSGPVTNPVTAELNKVLTALAGISAQAKDIRTDLIGPIENGAWPVPKVSINRKLIKVLEATGHDSAEGLWEAPGTSMYEKTIMLMEVAGFTFNEADGVWLPPVKAAATTGNGAAAPHPVTEEPVAETPPPQH